MGFGHRVYKNYDPRAKVMQKTCHEVLAEVGDDDDPLLQVAMELEQIALSDEYFIERKLYPNVDFYSGITLSAMGFPTEMFTVLFALARTVGWIAQWKEMIEDPAQKIGRPRQLYTGADRSATTCRSTSGAKPPAFRRRRGSRFERRRSGRSQSLRSARDPAPPPSHRVAQRRPIGRAPRSALACARSAGSSSSGATSRGQRRRRCSRPGSAPARPSCRRRC